MTTRTTKTNVVIVGNHFFFSTSMEVIINSSENFQLTRKFNNSSELLLCMETIRPEVIFWDSAIETRDYTLAHIKHVTSFFPSTKIVCVSSDNDGEYVKTMLEAGIVGFITKSCTEECYNKMLNFIHTGKKYVSPIASLNYTVFMNEEKGNTQSDKLKSLLTKRELQVLSELVNGLSCKQIGLRLNVSYKTVEVHIQKMMRKFNVNKSTELVALAFRYNLVD